ncbi:photosynthetic reaction center cytochrome PufC [Rhodovulum sp.]|uniref:photosynthetic reaction center cytochrome PufC n=1 Tax=Rhodovulum sp. TaxID=34009 RepID=UPI00257D915F|nr:photosynthetic reaction center cytochrome PufC [Rhodovulum sp.]
MLKLPKWFFKWSEDNPTDLIGPGILAGVVGGAAAITAIIVAFDNPYKTVDYQTGPRGIGMDVSKFVKDNPQYDPYEESYQAFARPEPQEGEPTAAEAYGETVIAFGDMPQSSFDRLQEAMSAWVGAPVVLYDNGEVDETTLAITRSCVEATQYLNTEWDTHNLASDGKGVNCYTCHRGQPTPPGSWLKAGVVNSAASGWAGVQNRLLTYERAGTTAFVHKYTQSEFTSLPVDAVEKFLLDGESIKVHDLESRVAQQPGDPTWQDAERTFSLMNHQANALDVSCVFCHNTRAFYDATQVTPAWSITMLAQQMAIDINQTYYEPRSEILGRESAKVNCMTCHMEVISPLNGRDMVAEWPELASPVQ